LDPTAVPREFAASFAPMDHPRAAAMSTDRKMRRSCIGAVSIICRWLNRYRKKTPLFPRERYGSRQFKRQADSSEKRQLGLEIKISIELVIEV